MFYLILLSCHIVSVCLYFCLELYSLKTFPQSLLSWMKLQWHPSSVQRPCFSSRRFSCAVFSCCLPVVFLFSFHTVPALVPFLVQFVFDWSEFFLDIPSALGFCVRKGCGHYSGPKEFSLLSHEVVGALGCHVSRPQLPSADRAWSQCVPLSHPAYWLLPTVEVHLPQCW